MSVFVLLMRYLLSSCMSMVVRGSFSPINPGNKGTLKTWTTNVIAFMKFAMTSGMA